MGSGPHTRDRLYRSQCPARTDYYSDEYATGCHVALDDRGGGYGHWSNDYLLCRSICVGIWQTGRPTSVLSCKYLYSGEIMRYSLVTIVFPAQAEIQRSVSWIPAFAGMTD
jgi:hypothetical protein